MFNLIVKSQFSFIKTISIYTSAKKRNLKIPNRIFELALVLHLLVSA